MCQKHTSTPFLTPFSAEAAPGQTESLFVRYRSSALYLASTDLHDISVKRCEERCEEELM